MNIWHYLKNTHVLCINLTSLVVIPSVTQGRARMHKTVTWSPSWSVDSETDGHGGVAIVVLRDRLKMQDRKNEGPNRSKADRHDWKMRDQISRVGKCTTGKCRTENAGLENAGPKMQGWKMQDRKMRDQFHFVNELKTRAVRDRIHPPRKIWSSSGLWIRITSKI